MPVAVRRNESTASRGGGGGGGKVGTDNNNGVIELLDSDSEDEHEKLTSSKTNFRELDNGCLEIIDSDDDDDDDGIRNTSGRQLVVTSKAANPYSKKSAALKPVQILARTGKKKQASPSAFAINEKYNRLQITGTATKRRSNNTSDSSDQEKSPEKKLKIGKSGKSSPPSSYNKKESVDEDEDDEAIIVAAPSTAFVPAVASMEPNTSGKGDDDEIQLVGHTGNNALEDFPHCKLHYC
jgi:hypothetical protein